MKRKWLLGILVLLMTALLATAAFANSIPLSVMSLDADILNVTLTKKRLFGGSQNVALNNTSNSSVAVSGSAFYSNPDYTGTESFSDSTSGTSPSLTHNGTFLKTMEGSVNGTHLRTSLEGLATYSLTNKTGYVTETVTATANYTTSGFWWLLPQGKFTIPYSYSYSLDNELIPEYYFYAVSYNVKATVYVNGLPVMTATLLDFSQSTNDPHTPLADIEGSYSGELQGTFNPWLGAQNVRVVLTETMTGYTAPVPPSALLLGSGLLGLGLLGWRRKRS